MPALGINGSLFPSQPALQGLFQDSFCVDVVLEHPGCECGVPGWQKGCDSPMVTHTLRKFGHWERKGFSSGNHGGVGTSCMELCDLRRGWV